MQILLHIVYWSLLLLVICSTAYHFICLYSGIKFFKQTKRQKKDKLYTPPVSILKPVRGVDSRAYDCWVSFCEQDYPEFEIIFGIRDSDDPAIPLIKKLQKEYPDRQIRLVVDQNSIGVSAKVSNLHNIYVHAKYETICISDSDILVGPSYLREVVFPLSISQVGLVTCMYRAIGSTNFSAIMETVGITGEFMLGVLTARELEGMEFALGSTIVTHRKIIDSFGGFKAIANSLGDDFMMGNLAAKAEYEVVLSTYVVETVLPKYTFKDFIQHQLRWALGTKYSRPSGYLGLLFTYTTVLALLLVILFPVSVVAWGTALVGLVVRFIAAWYVGVCGLKDMRLKRYFYLLPIRDILSFVIWAMSFFGDTVHWRGDKFRLIQGGHLVPFKK